MLEITEFFDSLADVISSSPWTYLALVGLAALDVIFPVVPSETSVLLAGVLAATGDLSITLVILSAAVGAFLGDNLSYFIGRKAGEPLARKILRGRGRSRLEWAERQIADRGGYLIIVGRFIPGGRTAVTLAAGILRMAWPRFAAFDAVAAVIWALQAALPGFIGGKAFEEEPWKGFLVGIAITVTLVGSVEGYRWLRRRRRLSRERERLLEAGTARAPEDC